MMFFLSDEMPFSFDELLLFGAASGGKAIEDTATGNPLVFLTDLARPLKSLLIPFTPQQTGSGDPSPVNDRPIVPWNGLNVFHVGANLFNKTGAVKYKRYLSGAENRWIYSDDSSAVAIPAEPNTTYHIYTVGMTPAILRANSTDNETLPTGSSPVSVACEKARGESTTGELSFTTGNGAKWLLIQVSSNLYDEITNVLVVTDETPSVYPISFPSPIYGGTPDVVSGKLTVTMVARVFDGSSDEQWGGSSGTRQTFPIAWAEVRGAQLDGKRVIACNMLIPTTGQGDSPPFGYIINNQSEYNIRTHLVDEDITQEQFRALLAENPLVVVCPLKTPQEIQLTPAQITALVGNNTIWSGADGSMTAVYLKRG